jgi:hypothetical protein
MKRLFYLGLLVLIAFEVANVYFIMPLPGSQRVRNVELAYQLYTVRWLVRSLGLALLLAGAPGAFRAAGWRRVPAVLGLLLVGLGAWQANFKMAADAMFLAPTSLNMATPAENAVALDRLVVGLEIAGDARAYPIQFIGYHHQVTDTVAGRPVLVSYCTVCRTGRVFSPFVEGVQEGWRLVGMDQFNAMFEDQTTGSWWRQANGEALVGPRKGSRLEELPSRQVTLAQWLALHPQSRVMQADPVLQDRYATSYAFEDGTSSSRLTGSDTTSWAEKAWVVGITLGGESRAYDWNTLRRTRVINDVLGNVPLVLALAADGKSFFAFQRPSGGVRMQIRGDSLVADSNAWSLGGLGPSGALAAIQASQEFWHSWRTFQPGTSRYPPEG